MSLSLKQQVIENTKKQLDSLKRKSLQSSQILKSDRLKTEEQISSNNNNPYDLQNIESNKRLQLFINTSKENKTKNNKNNNNNTLNIHPFQRKQSVQLEPQSFKEKQLLSSKGIDILKQRKSHGQLLSNRSQQQFKSDDFLLPTTSKRSINNNNIISITPTNELTKIIITTESQDLNSPTLITNNNNNEQSQQQKLLQQNKSLIKSNYSSNNNSNKNNKTTRSSFLGQFAYYEQQAEQKRQNYKIKQKEKKQQYKKFLGELESRRETFSKFSFKSQEIDENPFINPLMQKVNNIDMKGSMHVIDLWEDKALKKYLNYSKLKDGKYMLRGIAQQISYEQLQMRRDQPTIFTKKDENILQNKLSDKESMNQYLKSINEDYSKNEKILDRQIQKSGLSQAIPSRQSIILPAETNFQNILNHKRKSEIGGSPLLSSQQSHQGLNQQQLMQQQQQQQYQQEQDEPFDDIQFIQNFFNKTQQQQQQQSSNLFNLSPSKSHINNNNTNFLSPNYQSNPMNQQYNQNIDQSYFNTPNKLSTTRKSNIPYFFPVQITSNDTQSHSNNISDFNYSNNNNNNHSNTLKSKKTKSSITSQFLSHKQLQSEPSPAKMNIRQNNNNNNEKSNKNKQQLYLKVKVGEEENKQSLNQLGSITNMMYQSQDLSTAHNLNSRTRIDYSKSNILTPKSQTKYGSNRSLEKLHLNMNKDQISEKDLVKQFNEGKQYLLNQMYSSQNKQSIEELNSELKLSMNTSRDIATPSVQKKVKESINHINKISHIFKEIDTIQKLDAEQKRKMDDLIERIQDKVIISIENQKKKILDNDRMKNLTATAQ